MADKTVEILPSLLINVDDYEAGRYAQTRLLRQAGYRVLEAGTGSDALRMVAENHPALVLLDVNLPDIGGLEVCRRIKSDPALSTCVLQVSASAVGVQDQVSGLDTGADVYLTAPVNPEILLATVRSLVRLHELKRQLADERDYAHSIVETIREPLLVLDAGSTMKIRSANRAFYQMFELRAEDIESQPLAGLQRMFASTCGWATMLMECVQEQKSFDGIEVQCELPGLGTRTLMLSGQRLRRETDNSDCILCVFQDITERRQAEEAQLRWNQELQYFNRAASHDLQEPLRMISSFAGLLEKCCRGDLDTDGQRYLGFVLDGSRRLQGMLEDLLTYARNASAETPPSQSIHADTALRTALANLQLSIEETRADVQWNELPTLQADTTQLTQLFQNLVGNAIKYKGLETPSIRVDAERRAGDWIFSVRDNGMGFPQEYAEKIFLPFSRLHGRHIAGSGIGLALCKHIVERHGGRIWAESREGHGASFFFTFPVTTQAGVAC